MLEFKKSHKREEIHYNQAAQHSMRKCLKEKKALDKIRDVMQSLKENAKVAKYQVKESKEKILIILRKKLDERAEKMKKEVDKV